jgi:hypothetical protein
MKFRLNRFNIFKIEKIYPEFELPQLNQEMLYIHSMCIYFWLVEIEIGGCDCKIGCNEFINLHNPNTIWLIFDLFDPLLNGQLEEWIGGQGF